MRASAALLAAGLALAAAGCGGSGGSPPAATRTIALTPQEQRGKALFVRTCGSCHTLAEAGTSGSEGPSLDDHPWRAVTLEEVIASGPGLMPAGLLAGADARAVSTYVQAVTRR